MFSMLKPVYIYITCFVFCFPLNGTAQTPFILDADTGNEVDDYYALARALAESSWEITSLNATQWQTSQAL